MGSHFEPNHFIDEFKVLNTTKKAITLGDLKGLTIHPGKVLDLLKEHFGVNKEVINQSRSLQIALKNGWLTLMASHTNHSTLRHATTFEKQAIIADAEMVYSLTLNDLTNVNAPSSSNNQLLASNGSSWRPTSDITVDSITADEFFAKMGVSTQLWNVTNEVFETATAGTEYYSPDQHGGIWGGIIYRRYYAVPDASGTGDTQTISLGFTIDGVVVSLCGQGVVTSQSGVTWWPIPYSDFGGGTRNIELVVNTTTIVIHAGSGSDWKEGGFLWVDYTKA